MPKASPPPARSRRHARLFFSRRKTVENALQRWGAEGAGRVLERLQNAVLQTRRRPDLAEAIARHTLLAIALDGGRSRGG